MPGNKAWILVWFVEHLKIRGDSVWNLIHVNFTIYQSLQISPLGIILILEQ